MEEREPEPTHSWLVCPLLSPSAPVSFPTFHSSACRSLNLSPNFCEFPWLPPPYLLCLPPAHFQHPPPHSCFRIQLLLFPKKSMYVKHFVFLLPHSLPFANLIDNLYDKERAEQEFKGTSQTDVLSPATGSKPPLSGSCIIFWWQRCEDTSQMSALQASSVMSSCCCLYH